MSLSYKETILFIIMILLMSLIFSCDNENAVGINYPVVSGSAISIPDSTFDFGFVPQNAEISHIYRLHSIGDDTVKIISIRPSCGCSIVPLVKDQLPPGESIDLEVIYNTRTYLGSIIKHPLIISTGNDGDTVRQNVTLTADIYTSPDSASPIIVTPYKFLMSHFNEKNIIHLNFSLKNTSSSIIYLRLEDYPADLLKVFIPHKLMPGETSLGSLFLTNKGNEVEFQKSITIHTDFLSNTNFTIPVVRTIRFSIYK